MYPKLLVLFMKIANYLKVFKKREIRGSFDSENIKKLERKVLKL
jgi:hypothetical protein